MPVTTTLLILGASLVGCSNPNAQDAANAAAIQNAPPPADPGGPMAPDIAPPPNER